MEEEIRVRVRVRVLRDGVGDLIIGSGGDEE